jgi:hypothetical protein
MPATDGVNFASAGQMPAAATSAVIMTVMVVVDMAGFVPQSAHRARQSAYCAYQNVEPNHRKQDETDTRSPQ